MLSTKPTHDALIAPETLLRKNAAASTVAA
jgi:hypothetical protein